MLSFFRRLWEGETDGLSAAAFIVGAASLASRLVGVLRDRILASQFGAGNQLDAYYAAFRLPDFLYNLIILGALTAGFIPVFTEYLERKGKEEAMRLGGIMVSWVGIIMGVFAAALILAAPVIVPWITPGFDPEKMALTIQLSRIMFLSPLILGLSAVMGGILQSTRRFMPFALAPVLYNIGIIFGALFLAPRFGMPGLAWGVVIGAFFHFLAQASVVIRMGLRRLPRPTWKHEGVRRIMKLMAPRTVGLAVTQINLVILLALASSLPVGSVAVFNLANNLQSFPVGIIGISFAVAAFPALSRAIGVDRKEDFRSALMGAGKKIIFLILPTTALFILLRAQIVRLILGQGKFDWDDTIRTANVLGWFTLSLATQSLVALLARAFYAMQNTWTPLWIGAISEAVNLVFALYFRTLFGITGLAIAFSAASFAQFILLLIFLRIKFGPLGFSGFLKSFFKTLAACAAGVAVAYPLRVLIGTVYPLRTFFQVALQAGLSTIGGGLAFILAAWLLRSPELNDVWQAIKRRLWRKARVQESMDEAQGV
ncbi:MAG TPA: murein biosynthesis integral membrane protein MurJ [Patescibacteria group bacterium]|nr:murein biosynthesis integral membrane protein MurJ [Patescibacteria group bacterium]